jgi:O-antigen ligase
MTVSGAWDPSVAPALVRLEGASRSPHSLAIRAGAASWAALAIGAVTSLSLEMIGIVYVAEILLAATSFWAVVSNLGSRRFWRAPFGTFCVLLTVSLAGYAVSDFVWQTGSSQLLRGWARILVLASNLIGLHWLCRKRPANFLMYCAGSGAGSLLVLTLRGQLLTDWKFGASVPLTLLIACVCSLATPQRMLIPSIGLGAIGLVHILLDSRAIGGSCLVASLALMARHAGQTRRRRLRPLALLLASLTVTGLFAGAYAWSEQSFAKRRGESAAWRAASLATAIGGIARSPWIGNGSQASDFPFQSEYASRYAASSGARYRGLATDTSTFTPHSQILQAWFEAGIPGVLFFLFLGWRLILALQSCIFDRTVDYLTALFILCLLRAGWHLLFSPFAGQARLEVAAAAAIVGILEIERRRLRQSRSLHRLEKQGVAAAQ